MGVSNKDSPDLSRLRPTSPSDTPRKGHVDAAAHAVVLGLQQAVASVSHTVQSYSPASLAGTAPSAPTAKDRRPFLLIQLAGTSPHLEIADMDAAIGHPLGVVHAPKGLAGDREQALAGALYGDGLVKAGVPGAQPGARRASSAWPAPAPRARIRPAAIAVRCMALVPLAADKGKMRLPPPLLDCYSLGPDLQQLPPLPMSLSHKS